MTVSVEHAARISDADTYLAARTGRYEWRCARYDAAIDAMERHHIDNHCTVIDVGAGWTEFGARLVERGHRCRYVPVDAGIDGVDLDLWYPPRQVEWFVCLEVLEHLTLPERLIVLMQDSATRGIVVSTPNPKTTDVLGMDATHRTPIHARALREYGFHVTDASFYGQPADSLFAVWER
jgi:hypothetical protein